MKPDLAEFLERYSVTGVRAYVFSAVAVLAATGLRLLATPVLGDHVANAFHAIVLVIIASLAGFAPSLFGVAVALFSVWYFDMHPMPLQDKIANRSVNIIAAVTVCFMTAKMRTALLSAARAQREADFLGREMHHRVKNLFAVVASMVTLSAREKPEARDVLTDLRARVQALAHAHDVAFTSADVVSLPDLVNRLLAPHAHNGSKGPRVEVSGEPLTLPADYMTPLGLIFNELATNAAKYGSLATASGQVRLDWRLRDDTLSFRWEERGTGPASARAEIGEQGFGSLLVEASAAQLRGEIDRNLMDDGLVVRLSIPISANQRKQFRSADAADSQKECKAKPSFLSALRASNRFSRRRHEIKDSRS